MGSSLSVRFGALGVLAVTLPLLAGCQPAERGQMPAEATVDTAGVRAGVASLREAYIAAYNAGDTAGVAGLYTADAVLLPPDAPPVAGRDSIRSAIAQELAQGAELQVSPTTTTVAGSDWAFEYGTWQVTVTPEGADTAQTTTGSYLVVVRRTPDGWKLARVADTYDQPPPGAGGE